MAEAGHVATLDVESEKIVLEEGVVAKFLSDVPNTLSEFISDVEGNFLRLAPFVDLTCPTAL